MFGDLCILLFQGGSRQTMDTLITPKEINFISSQHVSFQLTKNGKNYIKENYCKIYYLHIFYKFTIKNVIHIIKITHSLSSKGSQLITLHFLLYYCFQQTLIVSLFIKDCKCSLYKILKLLLIFARKLEVISYRWLIKFS